MLSATLEQERLLIAARLLSEIERRHGLPHPIQRELHPVIMDRFLCVYLPEAREGEPAPQALEYAFAPALVDALDLLVCPAAIGGLDTPSLFDGPPLERGETPTRLRLLSAQAEPDGLLRLRYDVIAAEGEPTGVVPDLRSR